MIPLINGWMLDETHVFVAGVRVGHYRECINEVAMKWHAVSPVAAE
jgi:hypothetical protein